VKCLDDDPNCDLCIHVSISPSRGPWLLLAIALAIGVLWWVNS